MTLYRHITGVACSMAVSGLNQVQPTLGLHVSRVSSHYCTQTHNEQDLVHKVDRLLEDCPAWSGQDFERNPRKDTAQRKLIIVLLHRINRFDLDIIRSGVQMHLARHPSDFPAMNKL